MFERLLATHSRGEPAEVTGRLVEQLCLYDWPFNVRELDLVVRRLLALRKNLAVLNRSDLPQHILLPRASQGVAAEQAPAGASAATPTRAVAPANHVETKAERTERELTLLLAALRRHDGIIARAAEEVGITRQKAYRLMGDNAIDREELRGSKTEAAPRAGSHRSGGRG
jgi:DNA-binding NtrC family response regulator